MTREIVVELVELIPSVLWILFATALVVVFYRPIRRELIPRISGFKAFGVEATFVREQLDQAVAKQAVQVSENDRSQVLRRARMVARVLQGAQVLWVDDNPDYNLYERRVLRSFGVFVDLARSTSEALAMVEQTSYDAVISDVERDGIGDEGIRFLAEMVKRRIYRWAILYAGSFDRSRGIPPYAFGMTDRPDHLLHYVMDILERERS